MPTENEFAYQGYGVALSGLLRSGTIPSQASCGIPIHGGFSRNETENFRFEDVLSVSRAFGSASGTARENDWLSLLRFGVRDCNILGVVTADQIELQLHSQFSGVHGTKRRDAIGSRFENLRIAGYPVRVELDITLDAETNRRRIPGSFAVHIETDGPGLHLEKNSIIVPDFGTVRIAEASITRDSVSATMLEIEFRGDKLSGRIAIASGSLNGSPRNFFDEVPSKRPPIEQPVEETSLKMDEEELEVVLMELRGWMNTHPNPKAPFLFFMGKTLTPEEFLNEVENKSRIGIVFLNILVEQGEIAGIRPRTFAARAREANVAQ